MALLLIVLGFLPSFAWLLFFLQEDSRHPEPRRLLIYTFVAGVLSTVLVLQGQLLIHNFLTTYSIGIYSTFSLFVLAAVEEFFKFGAAFAVMKGRRELDEPIDPMIYMITAALGFAAVENIASIFRISDGIVLSIGSIETTVLRFVGATLLHALSSALVGYYWGRSMAEGRSFWKMIILGLVLATALHTVFNYFIIRFEPATMAILFLVFFGFFILADFEKLKMPDEKV